MIEACHCDAGLGVAHSHLTHQLVIDSHFKIRWTDAVQVWVDWKAVARALIIGADHGT